MRRSCQPAFAVPIRAWRAFLVLLAGLLSCALMPAFAAAQPVQTAAVQAPPLPVPAQVLDARLGVHPDKTRFVLELTEAVAFRVEPQASPASVVVELGNARWAGGILPGRGLVSAIASEMVTGDRLRLVLATTVPVRIAWAEVIPPRDGKPPRFILDLEPGTGAASERRPVGGLSPLPGTGGASAATVAASLASSPRPPIPPKERPKAPELPLIVLDAGHGGQDPGAVAVNGVYEKDITLAMARELRRQLLATGRYRVVMTRNKDVFLPLRDRAAVARSNDADLFISLHADSITSKKVRGLSVYTLSDRASDKEAEMLAQRENKADAIGGLNLQTQSAEVTNILISLSQREKMNQSRRFAGLVVSSLDKKIAVLPSPLRSAGFGVLTAPDVPSVLVEMGYLSHAQDASLLTNATHRRRMAASLLRAVDGYFSSGAGRKRS